MPQAKELDIYLILFKYIKYLYTVVRNFPKEYKYTLGGDILSMSWKVLDYVVLANECSNKEKRVYIHKSMCLFNSLKYRIRMASEIKILDHKKFGYLIEQGIEINKRLRGWYMWSKRF